MKERNIVLLSLDNGFTFSYGIPYLDAYLRKEGIEAKILFPKIRNLNKRQVIKNIINLNPIIVGLGGLFHDIYEIKDIISGLEPYRNNFTIVIGGYLVTPIPEFALLKTNADIAVIGEGEIIFSNLVKTILGARDIRNVKGIAIRDGNKVILTGPGPFIEDLSGLPEIDYDKFPLDQFIKIFNYYKYVPQNSLYTPASRVFWIQTGRGCPFECNFCYHHSKFRVRKIPDVIREAKELTQRYRLNIVRFQDDLLTINKKRTLELCNAIIQEKLKIKYIVSGHFAILDEEMVRALKESGCIQISLGIESGSQRILDMIGKGTRVEKIDQVMRLIRKYEIDRGVSIQMGQPGETKQEIEKTVELLMKHIDEYTTPSATITTPYPGSHLYGQAIRDGLIKGPEDFYNRYKNISNISVNFSALSDKELNEVYNKTCQLLINKKWEALKRQLGKTKFYLRKARYRLLTYAKQAQDPYKLFCKILQRVIKILSFANFSKNWQIP